MALARAYEQRSSTLAVVAVAGRSRERRHTLTTSSGHSLRQLPTPHSQALHTRRRLLLLRRLQQTQNHSRSCRAKRDARTRCLDLCFNCDEQYTRGHKCQKLFYLEVADSDEDTKDDQEQHVPGEPLISLHAIAGVRSDDTMKVRVQVGEQEFTALINTWSTHNFFSAQAAQAAELQFEANTGTRVTMANGDRMPCSGLARDVEIKIGTNIFTINAYSIPLVCFDVVLGVALLKPLHTVMLDFDDLVVAFNYNGKHAFWKGLGSHRCDIPTTARLASIRQEEETV